MFSSMGRMATSSPCNTVRALRNETTETVQQIERELGCDLEALMPHIAGRVGRGTYETGDTRLGALSVGQSDAFADRIEPLATIVRRIRAPHQRGSRGIASPPRHTEPQARSNRRLLNASLSRPFGVSLGSASRLRLHAFDADLRAAALSG